MVPFPSYRQQVLNDYYARGDVAGAQSIYWSAVTAGWEGVVWPGTEVDAPNMAQRNQEAQQTAYDNALTLHNLAVAQGVPSTPPVPPPSSAGVQAQPSPTTGTPSPGGGETPTTDPNLAPPPGVFVPTVPDLPRDTEPPSQFGDFGLLTYFGEGGQGDVYSPGVRPSFIAPDKLIAEIPKLFGGPTVVSPSPKAPGPPNRRGQPVSGFTPIGPTRTAPGGAMQERIDEVLSQLPTVIRDRLTPPGTAK